ncbi:short chain dehydrogenase, putative [Bodo saltans]|uniref:Short chain dehydrogenase, putative n=1 Tax=Bodo saltans TaxID=75058 RepID=A0A0S4IVV8_BODSA|nr:short chain dehydrogenase, putative [Bodo saltans]|eukprot:CUG05158.1 short chain dehydrogenase, putative [Bodo saltans]
MGSHAAHADPTSAIYGKTIVPYNASKAALNLYTQNLAHALKDEKFKVNSGCPGWVKTDMGGKDAFLEVEEGAETSVYLATLGADGPTGGFFSKQQPIPW